MNVRLAELEEKIDALRNSANALAEKQDILNKKSAAEDLEAITKNVEDTFFLLRFIMTSDSLKPTKMPEFPELKQYLSDMIEITEEIRQNVAKEKDSFANPNLYMQKLINAFEAFASKIATPQTRQRLRQAVSFIPVIDGVVSACGGIPYYFEHANQYEKMAMVLSAVLLVTALALTISVYTSPAVAAVPLLWPTITVCVLLSRMLYDQVSLNAKEKYETKPKIFAASDKLDKVTGEIEDFSAEINGQIKNMNVAVKSLDKFIEDTSHYFHATTGMIFYKTKAGKTSKKEPKKVDTLRNKFKDDKDVNDDTGHNDDTDPKDDKSHHHK